jgi:peroxiredoxin
MNHKALLLLSLVLLMTVSLATAAVAPWEIDEIMGKEAPNFTLRDLSGSEASLSSHRGKVVLINFWATWCKPCKNEMPSFNSLFNRFKDKGFIVLGISIDKSKKPVQKFLNKIPVDFPILLDSDIVVAKAYKVYAYPTTFLVDRDGVLSEKFIGEKDWLHSEMIELIERYLK